MSYQSDTLDVIERELADIFRRLIKEKPNVSFVYSYVYATDKDIKKARVKGRLNMHGSKEEVTTHLEELQDVLNKEEKRALIEKKKAYGIKKD